MLFAVASAAACPLIGEMPDVALQTLSDHIATRLRIGELPDYPGAMNGLQLQNRGGRIVRLLAAVDASLPVIRKAAAFPGPSLLIVHHGLFWKGAQMITGAAFEKLRIALDADLALYSAHLPLDVHPVLGNNACLAAALGFRKTTAFFDWKSMPLGLRATVNLTRDALTARLAKAVGGPVHVCPGGPERIRQVGLITGGAGSEVSAIAATGVDTFITGEGPHWSYPAAEEAGINLLYGGHYATETFGVKALAAHLAAAFELPWEFIDHPTGL
jgi:dinuclear metal center YbgI/SA1388 family protein